jgi:V/A-type H+/Na+-transporting ATPase subunit E
MSEQLQGLLQRIHDEGVAKAREEARNILEEAQAKADGILEKAEADAKAIVETAGKKAEELDRNTRSDLKMGAQQLMTSLKQKITDLVLAGAIDAPVGKAFREADFVKKLILETLKLWPDRGQALNLTLPAEMQKEFEGWFKASVKGALDREVKLDYSPAMKSGFSVAPAEGTYKISFTDEDFAGLFKTFLRPRVQRLLFED